MEDPQGRYRYTDAQHVSDEVECVLVLGGDGTLLQAARDLVDRSIPLLGINMGTLGYLAEIDRKNIFPALDKLIGGEYTVEHRMMLTGTAFHQSRRMLADIALNDIVISRNGRLRVVDFNVYVDGAFLSSYTAGWHHHFYADGVDRIQSVCGRSDCCTGGFSDFADGNRTAYVKFQTDRASGFCGDHD